MLTQQSSLYDIYTQTFGKVKSGGKITNADYAFSDIIDAIPYNEQQRLAVTVATSDEKSGRFLRSKSELEAETQALLS